MQIKSIFRHGEAIPELYTCLRDNTSPPFEFEGPPPGTESLVLIVEDVDATPKPWTHWMVFNIPPDVVSVPGGHVPSGGTEGLANNHSFGYEGPCPRYFTGTHHYWFRLYALDTVLALPAHTERETVEEHMQGHVLAEAMLLGLCTAK